MNLSRAGVLALSLVFLNFSYDQELTQESFQKWLKHIQPQPDEVKWQKIPWRASFWDAFLEAQEKDKPILLWAMNGHPLACT